MWQLYTTLKQDEVLQGFACGVMVHVRQDLLYLGFSRNCSRSWSMRVAQQMVDEQELLYLEGSSCDCGKVVENMRAAFWFVFENMRAAGFEA